MDILKRTGADGAEEPAVMPRLMEKRRKSGAWSEAPLLGHDGGVLAGRPAGALAAPMNGRSDDVQIRRLNRSAGCG